MAQVLDCTEPDAYHEQLREEVEAFLMDPDVLIYAHHVAFDRAVVRGCWGLDIPIERWRCTMAQAQAHGLPGGLGNLGEALGVDVTKLKDKRGAELIQLFCKPRPKNAKVRRATPELYPRQWAEFVEYSRQDIVALREVGNKMPVWNYQGRELDLWFLDQRMNDRGFLVDRELATAAVEVAAVEQKRLKRETQAITDGEVESVSKRDQLLKYILEEHGVALPDMRADTLRRRAEDPELPAGVRMLLNIRLEATKTSTSKYKRALLQSEHDGALRGSTQFCGAARSGRWAGRGVQPQNMTRPTPGVSRTEIAQAIEAIKTRQPQIILDNTMRWLSDAVRGIIIARPGKKLVVPDLSNIEGRGLAELAGEEWKLQAYRDYDAGQGPDLYAATYARSFGVDQDQVEKWQRQIGKVMELGLGYEGGVGAFLTFAAVYNLDLDAMADAVWASAEPAAIKAAEGVLAWVKRKKRSTFGLSDRVYVACEVLKAAWREAHPQTQAFWGAAAEAYRQATAHPGTPVDVGEHIKVQRDGAWLRVRLPSGRCLCYLHPKNHEGGGLSYMGVDQYTRQWKRIHTYGGKLCIAAGTLVLARRGWVAIEKITPYDEVWDGLAWVTTGGAVFNGRRRTITAYGARMTHDHEVMTQEGWKHASQSKRHRRAYCRLPDGYSLPGIFEKTAVCVGASMRLWGKQDDVSQRIPEAAGPRGGGFLWVPPQQDHRRTPDHSRHEPTPRFCGVAQRAGPLSAADAPGLAQLRGAWHHCVRAVAEVFRELLAGHGAGLRKRADHRTDGQRQGVQPGELPLGDLQGAGQQHPTVEAVYDLLNCGPRHRFVIYAGGAPLIVHNCENWTQGWARDIMAWNLPAIEDAGYLPLLTVHDEVVAEAPDTDGFTAERMSELLAANPPWARVCPLAAKGHELYRYAKED